MPGASIALRGVGHHRWIEQPERGWQRLEVLHDVTLEVRSGESLAIVGPSGSGKSTLLRLINRLEERTSGEIAVDGRDVRAWDVLGLRRTAGSVSQVPAMFPGTVAENIGYGPRLRGEEAAGSREVAAAYLSRVGLASELLHREASALSVGQQQRVAIARALANRPRALLLDEPTSALDPAAAADVLAVIGELSRDEGLTVLMVTHVSEHARRVADRLAVLEEGRIVRDEGCVE